MKHTAAATCVLFVASSLLGCQSDQPAGSTPPGAVSPGRTANRPTTRGVASRAIAHVQDVTVDESQLINLLYESNGLDALLKLVQLNMAKAVTRARGLSVSPADVDAERKLTMSLAFPGQEESDYDNLLKQLLQQQRVSRAEFEVVMETNANLRALARGRSNADVSEAAIQNEFNLLYGERVRVRDIPVNNPQEVSEVQRLLAVPGTRFEDVARAKGKIPALAQFGGLLPEFARTTTGYSPVFVEVAFSLQPGQVSTDAIQDHGLFHVIKLEDKLPPRAIKLADVRDSVREQLITNRSNNLMAEMRAQLAQQAVRELKIDNAAMQKQFDARVAAANPKPDDKREVQRSLEERGERDAARDAAAATQPTLAPPATLPAATRPTTMTTTAPAR